MSERKRKRREWLDAREAALTAQRPRLNPFLCSWCGEPATERHYATFAIGGEQPGDHVASFCPDHAAPDSMEDVRYGIDAPDLRLPDSIEPAGTPEHGKVSGPPTEDGELGDSNTPLDSVGVKPSDIKHAERAVMSFHEARSRVLENGGDYD